MEQTTYKIKLACITSCSVKISNSRKETFISGMKNY